ncbi:C2H2 finger domain containing protein [Phlyctema vagabunda]|uniref:C2H2 finger domain containing protein n=1 Tax=Phlyctema vagabunda TaxID=108571 RepID=A0ABR4PLL0_9HELO
MAFQPYSYVQGWESYPVKMNEDDLLDSSRFSGTAQGHSIPAAPEPDMSYTRGNFGTGGTAMSRDYSGYSSQSNTSLVSPPIPSPVSEPATQYNGPYEDYELAPEFNYNQQHGLLAVPRYQHQAHNHAPHMLAMPQATSYFSNESHASTSRATPQSLGWQQDPSIWKLYRFKFGNKKFPYLELCEGIQPSYDCPSFVYLDPPKEPRNSTGYLCQHPDCVDKSFKRSADLGRHYAGTHATTEEREQFRCSYKRCKRAGEPFGRKDHYREHLREYHKEDLPKRIHGEESQAAWWAERKNVQSWWRCTKCLHKVHIAKDGFMCSECNTPCESNRAAAREQMAKPSPQEYEAKVVEKTEQDPNYESDDETGLIAHDSHANMVRYHQTCPTCNGVGWVSSIDQGSIPCQACNYTPTMSFDDQPSGGYDYDYRPYSNLH